MVIAYLKLPGSRNIFDNILSNDAGENPLICRTKFSVLKRPSTPKRDSSPTDWTIRSTASQTLDPSEESPQFVLHEMMRHVSARLFLLFNRYSKSGYFTCLSAFPF